MLQSLSAAIVSPGQGYASTWRRQAGTVGLGAKLLTVERIRLGISRLYAKD